MLRLLRPVLARHIVADARRLVRSHGSDEQVRALFERAAKAGGKSKRISSVYKKWAEWESGSGNVKGVERVRALEEQWREEKKDREEE